MQYPRGSCERCGGRLSEHIEGGYICLNCQERYPAGYLE